MTSIAATLVAIGALMSVAPTTAEAAQGAKNGSIGTTCPGSYIGGGALRDANGKALPFRLDIFYSSANGGTNCAKLYNNSGVRTLMEVKIEVTGDPGNYYAFDSDKYISYAGAARVYKTAGRCINVWSGAMYQGKYYAKDYEHAFCG